MSMSRSFGWAVALVAVAALAPAAARARDPEFALVGATAAGGEERPCVTGARASGAPVVLFGKDLRTCSGTTREVTEGLAGGACTRVEPAPGCEWSGLGFAVVGADRLRGLRTFPRVAVEDRSRVASWTTQVEARGLTRRVAATARRWRCAEPVSVAAAPAEAFAFDGLPRGLVFLRHAVTENAGVARYPGGTLFVVQGAAVTAPFDVHAVEPFAFGLDGAQYVVGGSTCGDCGARLDQIFVVEGGKLRLVYETGDLST